VIRSETETRCQSGADPDIVNGSDRSADRLLHLSLEYRSDKGRTLKRKDTEHLLTLNYDYKLSPPYTATTANTNSAAPTPNVPTCQLKSLLVSFPRRRFLLLRQRSRSLIHVLA
jgi:hypothetical protein